MQQYLPRNRSLTIYTVIYTASVQMKRVSLIGIQNAQITPPFRAGDLQSLIYQARALFVHSRLFDKVYRHIYRLSTLVAVQSSTELGFLSKYPKYIYMRLSASQQTSRPNRSLCCVCR